ncbi:MAG: MaoC family dehydratase [Pseudomonadota bacterium]
MPGLYFDDTRIGQKIEHRLRRTVTEADNVMFCAMTHNPQPLHLDAEYASKTEFGQRVVNSLFTMSLAVGISVEDTTNGTIIANLGFGETRFTNPVFHGDTLRFVTEVIDRRDSNSRPDAGIITFRHEGFNQREEMVCSITRTTMLQRSPT